MTAPCTPTLTRRHRATLRDSLQCSTRHGQAGRPQRAPVTLPGHRITGPSPCQRSLRPVATSQAGSVVSPRIHPQHHPTWLPRHPRRPRRLKPHRLSPSSSSPKYSTSQTSSAPGRLPRDVVEPSSGRRGSPTATRTDSCGVDDLHTARRAPAPSAVTGAIPPPCMNRAYHCRLRGCRIAPIVHLRSFLHFYRYRYLLSKFCHLR